MLLTKMFIIQGPIPSLDQGEIHQSQVLPTPTQDSDFVQKDSKRENNWNNRANPKMPP